MLIDGTTSQAPGSKGTDYRIHVTIDLLTLEFVDLTVTDKYIGESLNHYQVKPGDIVIADRGYSRHPQIVESMNAGADVIVRVHINSIQIQDLRNGTTASVWLYGKILYAIVLEKKVNRLSNPRWMNLDRVRKEAPWRILKMVKEKFNASVILVGAWHQERWEEALEVLRERPRRRKLQQIPQAAIELLAQTFNPVQPCGDGVVCELFNQEVKASTQTFIEQMAA